MSDCEQCGEPREEVLGQLCFRCRCEWQKREIDELTQWVADCQSGMYVNCVYCGHRYGPKEDTPVAMADVLRDHIEKCPKHPLSAAKAEIEQLRSVIDYLDNPQVLLTIPQPHRMNLSQLLHKTEEARRVMSWHYDGEIWSMGSCLHDQGVCFEYLISMNNLGLFEVARSTPELVGGAGPFPSLKEAKAFCEAEELKFECCASEESEEKDG